MRIQPYSHYDETEILTLYRSVGWSNYYEHPEMLAKSFDHSLCILSAWEEDRLLGLIRAVGDGHSIVFIQDLLVHPDHQRRGVGTALMRELLRRYAHVYQIQLVTDNTEKTKAFYRSMGLVPLEHYNCCAFIK